MNYHYEKLKSGLYLYDYFMLSTILKKLGFKVRRAKFLDSTIKEMREPMHVQGLPSKWQNLNKKFVNENIDNEEHEDIL